LYRYVVAVGTFLSSQIIGFDLSKKAMGLIGVLGLKVAQSAMRRGCTSLMQL
jgi:hypothetical protein